MMPIFSLAPSSNNPVATSPRLAPIFTSLRSITTLATYCFGTLATIDKLAASLLHMYKLLHLVHRILRVLYSAFRVPLQFRAFLPALAWHPLFCSGTRAIHRHSRSSKSLVSNSHSISIPVPGFPTYTRVAESFEWGVEACPILSRLVVPRRSSPRWILNICVHESRLQRYGLSDEDTDS